MTQGNSSHYQVLRIPVTATDKEIKVAYRKAARMAHPDHGGDPAAFRRVTLAYETLIDAKRRADYDRSYGSGSGGAYSTGAAGGEGAHFDAPAAGSRASANVRRPNTPRNTAADPPVYVPPFGQFAQGGGVPLIPEELARQQVHGMPRKRGIFGAEARIQREMRTVQLISRQILTAIPAARLINGLQSPADNSHIDHALLAGYRLAIIGSMLLPPGAYAWNGSALRHGGRSIAPPQLAHTVRRMQDIFPELNVTGWTVVHSTDGNLHEPVIDQHRRSTGGDGGSPGGSQDIVQVVNAAGLARGLKQFLSSGPAPNTVNVPVLARLLRGMH
ncbi:J domain-containing protein [Pseudarthrobacter sp. S9]|uniref:J domain-containing protein n=1 Tax=Pseudarthrobacter sp. S9 TaxID=3418421 RepID=UPI003D04EBED